MTLTRRALGLTLGAGAVGLSGCGPRAAPSAAFNACPCSETRAPVSGSSNPCVPSKSSETAEFASMFFV